MNTATGDEDEHLIMAQPVYGKLEEFSGENITTYLERMQILFTANGTEDDKKAAVLLSLIGGETCITCVTSG